MDERDLLVKKWAKAVERKQFDLADSYFQAVLEAGANKLDAMKPGAGDVWRGIARATATLNAELRNMTDDV